MHKTRLFACIPKKFYICAVTKPDAMPYIFRILLTLNVLFLLQGTAALAQPNNMQRVADMQAGIRYNESIYLISNYSVVNTNLETRENQTVSELLRRSVEGFYFYLRHNDKSGNVEVRHPDGSFTGFGPVLDDIRLALERDSLKFVTLFLDFNIDIELGDMFSSSGLADMIAVHKEGEDWPLLSDAVRDNKRLTIFEVTKHVNSPAWMNVMDDFVEHTDRSWGNYSRMPEQSDRKLENTLSLFDGYRMLTNRNFSNDDITEMARHTPYFIESFREYWIRDGRLPNFVLTDKYYVWMETLLRTLRDYDMVYGLVTTGNEPIAYVNWDEMSNATTGTFCFPLEPGTELMLAPSVPGYTVEPQKMYAKSEGRRTYIGAFSATPIEIGEDVELYLTFDGDEPEDKSTKRRKVSADNVSANFETTRGRFYVFGDSSRISLPTASEMNIRDHDFTMSAWVKIPEYLPEKEDYCVIGARNNAYQHGLHLVIRDQKPFMGFFNNDLQGNTTIEAGRWYNIIWRFNKSNGEQAIYVDGKLDAVSTGRPPYMGSDSLYVGYNQSVQSNFVGMLDNVCIWSRVLSEKEILGISNQIIDISVTGKSTGRRTANVLLTLVAVAIVFTALWTILVHRLHVSQRKKAAKSTALDVEKHGNSTAKPQEQIAQTAAIGAGSKQEERVERLNSIMLFGDFCVLDKDGEDITQLFTPKLKQLFMLLLLYSTKGYSGISGSDISDAIWGDRDSKNIRSLRSVSILKLRKILERMDKIEICYVGNKYVLRFGGNVSCDYTVCLDMIESHSINTLDDFKRFYTIIDRGEVFKDESFDWLDDFKSKVCNYIVDTLTKYVSKYLLDGDAEKIIRIANQILLNDPCNEEALRYKIAALIRQNNAKSAQYTYHKFCSLYSKMYGEDYRVSFDQIVETTSVKQKEDPEEGKS